jgi:hypothetical protein
MLATGTNQAADVKRAAESTVDELKQELEKLFGVAPEVRGVGREGD